MFSASIIHDAENASPAIATTRSRRRQRPLSSENLPQQPKAKRQRVPLNDQTFANSAVIQETYEVKSARPPIIEQKQDGIEESALSKQELSLRSKKGRTGERVGKGDGSILLVSCILYLSFKYTTSFEYNLLTRSHSRSQPISRSKSENFQLSLID